MPEPWKLLRERAQRDYRIFRTHTLEVADPRNGTEYVRTVIEAPDWVNIIPLTVGEELVLIRQFRFGTWATTLEIPGGMLDPGEDPQSAATRELLEETGFRPREVVPLGFTHPNPAIQSNRLHSYLALGCEKVAEPRQDTSEDIRVELVARAELQRLVRSGEISHSLVLAALLLHAWR